MPDDLSSGELPADEAVTLVTCMACGGNFKIVTVSLQGERTSICPWCTRGSMTASQVAKWHAHRQGRNR